MRLLPLLLLACQTPIPGDADTADPGSCAWGTSAFAGVLDASSWVPTGPDALAGAGDAILANPDVAFVVQGVDLPKTYYHYGGIPIDAVPMDGCAQVAEDRFGELGFVPGRLELTSFTDSALRQFRATELEIVSDGSDGGGAHVRVSGVDDRFWLVDYTLTRRVGAGGGTRPLSDPLGVEIVLDYRLPPQGRVLTVEATVRNLDEVSKQIFVGLLSFPSDRTQTLRYTDTRASVGGFGFDLGLPWVSMASREVSYAVAFDTPEMAFTSISGAEVLIEPDRVLSSDGALAPAGQLGDSYRTRVFVAVGDGESHTATAALAAARGGAEPRRRVEGTVAGANGPAFVDVERRTADGTWRVLDRIEVDGEGRFDASMPEDVPLRVVARAGLQVSSEGAELPMSGPATVALQMPEGAALSLSATDEDGLPMPAKASLFDPEGRVGPVLFLPPDGGTWQVPAGTWDVAFTRGYEYAPMETTVALVDGGTETVTARLDHVVDTSGWISVDGHVHAGPSADSTVLLEDRFGHAAAAGLGVVVHTEHEVIVDAQPILEASPWAGHVASVVGEEVSASMPEHLNMWGVSVSPDDGPRGAPVEWFGRDLAELFEAMRARGAKVVQLNHPRWLDDIRYDPVNGMAGVTDGRQFGLAQDAALWSWDLDAIELQNGFKYIFGGPEQPGTSGLFRTWLGFHNLGRRVTAVGVSDVHGRDTPGTPRTYVPMEGGLEGFLVDPLTQAVVEGRALVSTGAFARFKVRSEEGGVAGLGQLVTATSGEVVLDLTVQALPQVVVERVVVFVNGDAVDEISATTPGGVVKLDTEVRRTLSADAHVVLAGFGSGTYPRGLESPGADVARFVTNPVFVDVDGNGRFDPPGPKVCDFGDLTP